MNDTKLRDKLAGDYGLFRFPVHNIETTKEFTQDVNFARRMSHISTFQAGWDACAEHLGKERNPSQVTSTRETIKIIRNYLYECSDAVRGIDFGPDKNWSILLRSAADYLGKTSVVELTTTESPSKVSERETLEEKIKRTETVKGLECVNCGNPWWFKIEIGFQCTACGHRPDQGTESRTSPSNLQTESVSQEPLKPNEIRTMENVIEANRKFRDRIAELETKLAKAKVALEVINDNAEIAGVNADTMVARLALKEIKGDV